MSSKKTLCSFLIVSLAFAQNVGAHASEYCACSSSESKKKGWYLKEATVTPNEFEWKSHSVKIVDCWLERKKEHQESLNLCFKLLIDGKANAESKLSYEKFQQLEFRKIGNSPTTSGIGALTYLPAKYRIKAMIVPTLGEKVHFVNIKDKDAKEIALRVGTMLLKRSDPNAELVKLTDTTLEFAF